MIFIASTSAAIPMPVKIAASAYPATIPMMKGNNFSVFLPYTEQIIVTASVTRPQMSAR